MGKHISQDIINQIPQLYQELKVKTKVAEQLGISVSTVSKYLKLFEGNINSEKELAPKKKRTVVTDELIEKINEIYAQYRNLRKTGEELGISSTTVKKYLSEENQKIREKMNDDRDALWYYIHRLFGEVDGKPVSDWNLTQMMKFKQQGYTFRGQLLTLKYIYEVKKMSLEKAHGSIGLIPYKYAESQLYYSKLEKQKKEILEAIERQLEKDRIEIPYNPNDYIGKKKKKKEIDINNL